MSEDEPPSSPQFYDVETDTLYDKIPSTTTTCDTHHLMDTIEEVICRVCAESKEDTILIYGPEGIKMGLEAMIHRFLPILVCKEDDLPVTVCRDCRLSLEQSQSLFETSLIADMLLHDVEVGPLKNNIRITKTSLPQDAQSLTKEATVVSLQNLEITSPPKDSKTIQMKHTTGISFEPEKCDSKFPHTPIDSIPQCDSYFENEEMFTTFPIQCFLCQCEIRSAKEGNKHYFKNHNQRFCEYCFKTFTTVDILADHYNKKHTHTCSECNLVILGTTETFKKHKKIKHSITTQALKCKFCNQYAVSKLNLKIHNQIHHHKFTCLVCLDAYDDEENLLNHSSTLNHGCICKNCKQIFVTKRSLKEHCLKKHGEQQIEEISLGIDVSYVCKLCNAQHENQTYLKRHYTDFHQVLLCVLCDKIFSNIDQIDHHSLKIHGRKSDWRYKCTICNNKYYDRLDYLKTHIKMVHEKSNNLCEICGKEYKKKSDLKKHFTQVHSEEDKNKIEHFICTICDKNVGSKSNLISHTKRHSQTKEIRCNLCSKSFVDAPSLKSHITHVHTEKKFECSTCLKKFITKITLQNHIETLHIAEWIYTCNVCVNFYKSEYEFWEHFKTLHDGKNQYENAFTRISPYQCDHCFLFLANKHNLKMHIEKLHNITDVRIVKNNNKVCELCGEHFPTLLYLKNHLYRVHSKPREFQCDKCNKSFNSEKHLKSHGRYHAVERPYPCDICSKAFTTNKQMKTHKQRVHFADKSENICEHCLATFKNKHALKKHLKLHTGEEAYRCEICDRFFPRKYAYHNHMKRHELKKPTLSLWKRRVEILFTPQLQS